MKQSYYQKNRDAILQRAREYYENNKEKRQRNRFHNMNNEQRVS